MADHGVGIDKHPCTLYHVYNLVHGQSLIVYVMQRGNDMTATYRTDFYIWTQQQADLLRNEAYAELDLPNLIEEIESLGISRRSVLKSRLRTILEHMLKLTCEPESRAANKWRRGLPSSRSGSALPTF